ncbi:MAG: ribbon-helix-helix domain-containing protein [Candidatus Humimicrobiaceae bacterium]
MKRISIFLREDQIKGLNKLSDLKKISYSELVREAIDYKMFTEFAAPSKIEILKNSKGLLKDRFNYDMSSEEIVDHLRNEWETRIERNKKQ